MVGTLCGVLALAGCVPAQTAERADTSGGEPATANARGDNGDGAYRAPETTSAPAIFVALGSPYSAYNNATADMNRLDNTVVLNQVLVDPFVVDGNGTFLLNSDVMLSAELTSQDPQVVTYRIKPGVTWSDGEAWDCDDFYLAWLARSGNAVVSGPDGNKITYFNAATTGGQQWANGECRDGLTFVETYESPYVEWRRNYVQNAILPAHVLERVTGIPDITALGPQSAPVDLQKVGAAWNGGWIGFNPDTMPASGPYRIDRVQPDGQVVLVRNEKWMGNPGGPEQIVFIPVTDGGAAVQGLQNQELNVVSLPADPVLADRLRALSDQGVIFEVRGGPDMVDLNLNLARPLFQDPVLRAAFAECIDRNEVVEELVRGVSPVAQPLGSVTFVPGDSEYEDHYADKMPADTQQAQLTLERAGWVLGEDGVYSRAGQRLSFAISHDGSPSHSRAVELIRTHCRQAGMEIIDGAAPGGGLGDVLARRAFDVALTTVSLVPRVSSIAERYGGRGGLNYQSYLNPEVDDALAVAATEYVAAFQTQALLRADQLIAADLVSFPLFQVPIMWAYRNNIGNVFRHSCDGVTWNANEWQVS
ncbi:MAG: ABC transporter substrate-binding protein [Pseudonocardiaceae bacterium]